MKWAFLLSLISTPTLGSIFDKDDRVDTHLTDSFTQELARSVPAMIQNHRIKQVSETQFRLSGIPLSELNFCSDEAFAQETLIANCSASLIAANKVLTAAHCLDLQGYECSTYSVVFDYLNTSGPTHLMHRDQIYQCKKILYFEFDKSLNGLDLAVIELDRPVLDRTPIKLGQSISVGEKLSMIGYPLGISQKVVTSGSVLNYSPLTSSFHTDLDSFSVNSGGPIFNDVGEQVGVLVRGTGLNYQQYQGESCVRWHRSSSKDEFSAANDLRSLPTSLLNDTESYSR